MIDALQVLISKHLFRMLGCKQHHIRPAKPCFDLPHRLSACATCRSLPQRVKSCSESRHRSRTNITGFDLVTDPDPGPVLQERSISTTAPFNASCHIVPDLLCQGPVVLTPSFGAG